MAKEQVVTTQIKITPEQQRQVEGLDEQIETAEHALQGLKEMGMDTTALDKELIQAKQRRDTLLKYFT